MKKKLRTIQSAVAEIKSIDPSTAITEHFIRQLCITGRIPTIMAGKKYLLDLNDLEKYFYSESHKGVM